MAPQLSSSSTSLSSLLPQSLSSLFLFKIKPVQLAIEILSFFLFIYLFFIFYFLIIPSQSNLFKHIQLAIDFFSFLYFSQLNLFILRFNIYIIFLGEIAPFQLAAEIALTYIFISGSPLVSLF